MELNVKPYYLPLSSQIPETRVIPGVAGYSPKTKYPVFLYFFQEPVKYMIFMDIIIEKTRLLVELLANLSGIFFLLYTHLKSHILFNVQRISISDLTVHPSFKQQKDG